MIEEIGGDFLQWLRGFYFVAKTGSVTQAALEMGRNQPTVSHQIKCLEKEFGVTLFNRAAGKMELTGEGRVFLEKVISIFEIIKEMKNEILETRLASEGKIVVATTHAIIHFFLPRFIVDFKDTHPNVTFDIKGGGLEMILERVESAEADFGIANLPVVPQGLTHQDLFETRLKLIAAKGSPFFTKKRVTLKQISEAPFITFPHSSTLRPFIEKRFSENDLELNVVLVLNNYDSVKKFVALGLGVSILDDYALSEEDKERLQIFSLERFFEKRTYGVITRKKKYFSPAAKAFIRSIKPDIMLP